MVLDTNTFEALQKVSNQLATLNPASKEYGNVVSEVFRGAGEDAGQFVAQLGKIKVGFEDTSEQAKALGLTFQNEVKFFHLSGFLHDISCRILYWFLDIQDHYLIGRRSIQQRHSLLMEKDDNNFCHQ
jgi:hypothetical protein